MRIIFYTIICCIIMVGLQSCKHEKDGCTDLKAINFDVDATKNDGSCIYTQTSVYGCTNPQASNYDPNANTDDGTCIFRGCMDSTATNYDPFANQDDGSCSISGCMDSAAYNYNPLANSNDNSCIYDWRPAYLGTWTSENCAVDFLNYALPLTISVNGLTTNGITFSPFFADFTDRNAEINGKTITFPSQAYGSSGSFTGAGTLEVFPDTIMTIVFNYTDPLLFINNTCSATYTKQ